MLAARGEGTRGGKGARAGKGGRPGKGTLDSRQPRATNGAFDEREPRGARAFEPRASRGKAAFEKREPRAGKGSFEKRVPRGTKAFEKREPRAGKGSFEKRVPRATKAFEKRDARGDVRVRGDAEKGGRPGRSQRSFDERASNGAGRSEAHAADRRGSGTRAHARERPPAEPKRGKRPHASEGARTRERPPLERAHSSRERPADKEGGRARERPGSKSAPRARSRFGAKASAGERPTRSDGARRTARASGGKPGAREPSSTSTTREHTREGGPDSARSPSAAGSRAAERPLSSTVARGRKRPLAVDASRTRERTVGDERVHAHKRPLSVAGPRVAQRALNADAGSDDAHDSQSDELRPEIRRGGDRPLAKRPFSKRSPTARPAFASTRGAGKRSLDASGEPAKAREVSEEPHPGLFVLTTRVGSEQDLVDELALLGVTDPAPRILAPALVLAPKVPKRDKRPVELTFARQGFPIVQSVRSHDLEQTAARIARSLRGQLERAQHYALHVWVPDSDLGNPLSSLAEELEAKLAARLQEGLPNATRVDDSALRRLGSIPYAQVCLIDPERAVAGVTYSNAALSLARGGRTRVRVTGHFPSRAARKLEEALAWLGVEPSAGDVCVDLGAAPGGWTYVLADRRARVIAVDPAKLKPEILAMKGVRHVQESAFTFTPEGEVDWLFCDMAWRPLEAAALLAKWGRKHWARMLVANIKLPMKKKAELLERVRHILENEGNWKHVRTKQLYHDRDEITLTAHLV